MRPDTIRSTTLFTGVDGTAVAMVIEEATDMAATVMVATMEVAMVEATEVATTSALNFRQTVCPGITSGQPILGGIINKLRSWVLIASLCGPGFALAERWGIEGINMQQQKL